MGADGKVAAEWVEITQCSSHKLLGADGSKWLPQKLLGADGSKSSERHMVCTLNSLSLNPNTHSWLESGTRKTQTEIHTSKVLHNWSYIHSHTDTQENRRAPGKTQEVMVYVTLHTLWCTYHLTVSYYRIYMQVEFISPITFESSPSLLLPTCILIYRIPHITHILCFAENRDSPRLIGPRKLFAKFIYPLSCLD